MCSSLAGADSQILDGIGILNVAHRGGGAEAPENTLAAYQNSIANGMNFIECDVRKTADGVVVCHHDATVDRTTDGTGLLEDMTLAELKMLDAGSWFGPAFVGERIPTLEEALLLANGQAVILCDPKYPNWAVDIAAVHASTGLPASAIGAWANNATELNNLNTLIPGSSAIIRRWGATTAESTIEWFQDPQGSAIASAVSIQWTSSFDPDLQDELIHLFHTQGIPVISNITNNQSGWDTALALGLDGIMTQKPASIGAYFDGFECANGQNDDLDGAIDFPSDPECDWPRDASERATCDDGRDNDLDGFFDFPDDPGCSSPADSTETNPATPCDDGIDNDGDYYADLWDTGCNDLLDTVEGLPSSPPPGPAPIPGLSFPALILTVLILGMTGIVRRRPA